MNTKNDIKTAEQTPLFQAVYKLYLSWYVRCSQIPKKDRFTIGQKTENLLLEILILVVTAYHTNNLEYKKQSLSKANTLLECVKVTIRLAKDVKALEQRWYIDYQTRIQEMGKMLGGWISSTCKTNG